MEKLVIKPNTTYVTGFYIQDFDNKPMTNKQTGEVTDLSLHMTIAGCFTIVRVYKVSLNDDGTVKKMNMRRWYAFVHDDELRSCYDTYEKVERLSVKGFQPRSEQLSDSPTSQNVNISVTK